MQGIAKESADHMFWAALAPKYQTRKKPQGIEKESVIWLSENGQIIDKNGGKHKEMKYFFFRRKA